MVIASLCVGLTLPGMIDEPGSFSGIINSLSPQRGPDASQRMSLAIFISEAASVFKAPLQKTITSFTDSSTIVIGCNYNSITVSAEIFFTACKQISHCAIRQV